MSAQASAEQRRGLDAQARRRAQTFFEGPMVLEAGAGTGKTSVLVARVVTWCLGPGWPKAKACCTRTDSDEDTIAARVMQGVVAITFTEAAAAEMARRIGKALFALERGDEIPPGIDADALRHAVAVSLESEDHDEVERILVVRARALLGALDRLQARTIHSFCKKLLDEHPLEIGWHPSFEVDADGLELARIGREVLEEVLEREDSETREALHTLAAKEVGPGALEKHLLTLMKDSVSPQVLESDPLAPDRVQRAARELEASLRRVSEIASPAFSGAQRVRNAQAIVIALEASTRLIEPLATTSRNVPIPELLETSLHALKACWPENLRKHLKDKWAKDDLGKIEAECLGSAATELAARSMALLAQLEIWWTIDPSSLRALRHVLSNLLSKASERLRVEGVASFEALLIGALDLLRKNPGLCAQIRSGIDQLLVDEFQDTNRVQCELVERLALSGPEEMRPGLFLVGDPKQSIYGWRQADLQAYDAFVEKLCERGGVRGQLFVNFRSTEEVLNEVTEVIAPVMKAELGLQPNFAPLVPSGDVTSIADGVEYWVSWYWNEEKKEPKSPSAAQSAELEARAVAQKIRALHSSENVAWKEIGVLVRSNDHAMAFVEGFRQARIPYAVERDRNYYKKREIIDAAALLRIVLDPYDSLALVTWLRCSAVGVPDAALIPLWKESFPEKVAALRPCLAEEKGNTDAALTEALEAVERARAQIPGEVLGIERIGHWPFNLRFALRALLRLRCSLVEDPFDHFIARLRSVVLFEATEAARYLGAFRVANLERFFAQVQLYYREYAGDLHQLLRQLRRSLAQGWEAEEARPRAGFEDAVAVMTIHKAKGLEFDTVFLPGLHKRGRSGGSGEALVSRVEWDERAQATWEWEFDGYCSLGVGEQRRRRSERESAERVRLLYVAMTRAKRRLILLGNWPDPVERKKIGQARSALDLLCWRQSSLPDLRHAMEELVASGKTSLVEAGIRWCFPTLDRESVSERVVDGHAFKFELRSVEQSAACIQQQRAAASARMARRFGAGPSQWAHEERDGVGAERVNMGIGLDAAAAMAVGSVIHALLEAFDFGEDARTAFQRQRERISDLVRSELRASAEEEDYACACARTLALWDGFGGGPLFARFCEIGNMPHVRELPILLPPDGNSETSPVGFVGGKIDLCYRDASGEFAVVDYKTDRVHSEAELRERAERYRLQGAAYQRAVREAMGLEANPRFELWFLDSSRIWIDVEQRSGFGPFGSED